METYSALQVLCAGNPPVNGEFPSQRSVTRSFDVLFDLGLNGSVNNRDAGDLRRHRAHCDVTVMRIHVMTLSCIFPYLTLPHLTLSYLILSYLILSRLWLKETYQHDLRSAGVGVCKFHSFLVYWSSDFAAWVIVIVTLERFVSVVFPHRAKVCRYIHTHRQTSNETRNTPRTQTSIASSLGNAKQSS